MRQITTLNTISQTATDCSTGGAKVDGIFKNCSVSSVNKKALLIRFLLVLKKKTKYNMLFKIDITKNIVNQKVGIV